jgi:Ca2+-binding EF-hand superfamily protein
MRHNNLNELKEIFEYELKTKLSEKAKTSISEQKTLLNCFKYYDINNEGFADESRWINSILRTGITGFSHNDLEKLYKSYVSNPSDSINYQNFCDYIFGRENVGKISYANIRNNKMKNDMRDNNYYIRNNFQNIDLNKYNRNYLNKNREYENVSNKNQGNNYELLIEKLKEKINTNNGMTYYTLIKNLKANEEKLSQTVSLDELSISLQQLHLNISSNDIYELFNYLDSEKIGRISTSDILNLITEPINEKRTIYLVKVFKSIDSDKKGEISINKLKNIFNAKNHPDVSDNIRNEDEIYNQFCYTLDIFIRFNNILNYSINLEQFIDYYSGISPSIKEDEEFQKILEKVWDVDRKQKEKKKFYNIIYKNNYENYPEDSEMGINSLFFGESHTERPKYDYNYDYLDEFYKSSQDINIRNKYNKNINKNNNNIKNHIRSKTNVDLVQDTLERKAILNFNTLNNNKITNSKRYFGQESDNIKENNGKRIFKKKRYNPITDEFIQENNSFNTGHNIVNDLIKKDQIKKENEILIKEEINPEIEEYNTKNKKIYNFNTFNSKIKENESLVKFRKLLVSLGTKSIFRFQKMLSIYDRDNSGFISFENFYTIFQSNYIDIPLVDIKSIFGLFDNNNNEKQINSASEYKIKYDLLLKSIIGNISIKRRALIQKVFDSFSRDKNGKILISDMKNRFNPSRHPDVLKGSKTENKILGEFLDFLEIFREYYNNLHGGYTFNIGFQEFLEFYSEISLSIEDDKDFENLLINCWDLELIEQKDKMNDNNKEQIDNIEGNNIYKKIQNLNKNINENKQYNKNVRMRAGQQIINNRIFY